MDERVLREVMLEVGDGSLRFNEQPYHSPHFSDDEEKDPGNVVEDEKRVVGGRGPRSEEDDSPIEERFSSDSDCDHGGDDESTGMEDGDFIRENGNRSTENTDRERFIMVDDSEELEESGRKFAKGLLNTELSFEDLCPLTPDSLWCSSLKGKDVKTIGIGDFDNITFPTVEEAEKFYYYYAFMIGFSVKKFRRERREVGDRMVIWRRTWACSNEGYCCSKKDPNADVPPPILFGSDGCMDQNGQCGDPTVVGKKKKRKGVARGMKYTRTGCKANFTVKIDEETGLYHVFRFETAHNHGVAAVSERHFLRSFRKVTPEDLLEVHALQSTGLGVSGSFDFMARQNGGAPLVGFMLKDLYNKLDRYRRLNSELGDAEAAMNWLRIKGMEDPNFFCRYSRDEEGRLAALFWRDHASFLDYQAFGDVLIIDSTYKTNIYGMPLVLFVGANNHRASVLFGCGLVRDEKEDTFHWLIERFVSSMENKVPITVVTDGDERLHAALHTHLPTARQRLCSWHIGRNVGQNIKDEKVQKLLGKLIYGSYSIEEWDMMWAKMIAENDLGDNEWLKTLHDRRERWSETFFRGHHCGGICSTQRCEGMNNKVKTKVCGYTKLVQFVPRLYHSVGRLRDRYMLDDFKSRNYHRKFELPMKAVEEQVFNIFTDDIYLVIRGQMVFENAFNVSTRVDYEGSKNLTCYVTQYGVDDRCWLVTYVAGSIEGEGDTYRCSCQLFESDGIPCCHIFSVFKRESVKIYPKSLIWPRWTKDAGKKSCVDKVIIDNDFGESQACRYAKLIGIAKRACYNMSLTDEGFEKGTVDLHMLLGKYHVENPLKKARVNPGDNDNVVRDPVLARTKGSHVTRTDRNGQGNEGTGDGPKCKECHTSGHNKRTCPLLKKRDRDKGATKASKSGTVSQKCSEPEIGGSSASDVPHFSYNCTNNLPPRAPYYPQMPSPVNLCFGPDHASLPDMNSQFGASDNPIHGWGFWGGSSL
ncbi:protein FAR1-RELATED SEQUENCE 5-like [Argentina anserina]|uniref:protein FAR1-RELATED SEQUENCE 5-like n=1 Tax=Argentina anserina TaxID=57926 RepID=UPI00217623FE|nr:protein FAR1-RELATED SEQUENCE 5-like [Potentilla anserina]